MKSRQILSGLFTLTLGIGLARADVERIGDPWSRDDLSGREARIMLGNARAVMREIKDLNAQELTKRCSSGIRVVFNASFREPVEFVLLFDYKSETDSEGAERVAWQEYSFQDTTALTINRITKVFPIRDRESLEKEIKTTSLWKVPNQNEIKDFKLEVLDGYELHVQLFSEGRIKELRYWSPEFHPQEENKVFLESLSRLFLDLGFSPEGFAPVKPKH